MGDDREKLVDADALAKSDMFSSTPFGDGGFASTDESHNTINDSNENTTTPLSFRTDVKWSLPSESDVYISRLEKRLDALRSGKGPKRKGIEVSAVAATDLSAVSAAGAASPIENESLFAEFEHDEIMSRAPRNIHRKSSSREAFCSCCCVS